MCIVQVYTRWLCGCPVAEADKRMMKVCVKRVTMLAKSLAGAESSNGESTSSMGYCGGLAKERRAGNDDNGSSSNESDSSDSGSESFCNNDANETAIQASERLYHDTAPRLCALHETKFELGAHSFWVSELQWLRPRLGRRGTPAALGTQTTREAIVHAQLCADRMWKLYQLWKLLNGGSSESEDESDKGYERRDKALAVECAAILTDDLKTQTTDCCSTIQSIQHTGELNYGMLRWGLEDLLEPLRASLHPRDMVA
ncbi:hypothetical protein CMQ_1426 [Grosmannia clavigera kw1407]|uniref:Uncharacterized protein n=1 Tax=Grosmannia clavigera (strain kw1407 / UAMH 11150) TaxID=655863 RepID=F0XCF0_GROCL|nr:uncharacterized protein CMQ_1426 [Grosmannia clavigera kw1407]EFX04498.1 hypothetical protein CMQ_1426 [Grosmannia clavigera kw1407]